MPKTGRLLHCDTLRGEKGGLFFIVPGCAVKKAVCFSSFRAARRKRRSVLYRSGLRGEKGGLFFTVPGCAVKKAACFSLFRAARRKTGPPFTPPNTRGDANGGLLEGMSDEEGLQGLSLEAVADVARGDPLQYGLDRFA